MACPCCVISRPKSSDVEKEAETVLTFNDGVLFRSKLFTPDYRYTANFVDAWSIDEIVLLDISRPERRKPELFFAVVKDFSRKCFVPLCVGGGVRKLEDFKLYLDLGAEQRLRSIQPRSKKRKPDHSSGDEIRQPVRGGLH